jgi:SAM-dependent methyltransferase
MDKHLFDELYVLEKKHWWFVARRQLLLRVLDTFNRQGNSNKVLDAGCGTGFMLNYLTRFGEVKGMEFSSDARAYARENFNGEIKECSLPNSVPFTSNSFTMIVALDVIEHVEDDRSTVDALIDLVEPGGILLVTVPAFMILWSDHDVVHQHFRRYRIKELRDLFDSDKVDIKYSTYFNFFLFPLVLAARFVNKFTGRVGSDADMPLGIVNLVLKKIFQLEKILIPLFSFPFGVSCLLVARKR